jgi:hypothetical protein
VLKVVTEEDTAYPAGFVNISAYELLMLSPVRVEFRLIELSSDAVVDSNCPCVIDDE